MNKLTQSALLVLAILARVAPLSFLHAEDKVLPKQQKKIHLHAVRVAFKHTGMSNPKTIGLPNQDPGVLKGDSLNLSAILQPPLTLPNNRFTWSGSATGSGPAISPVFDILGNRTITLGVRDQNANIDKTVAVEVRVRLVGPEKESDICPSAVPDDCGFAFLDSLLVRDWVEGGDLAVALGFPRGPCNSDDGKCNAAKHAYWNLLMVRDTDLAFATRVATAHERYSSGYFFTSESGLDVGAQHNSVVMDLENNVTGRAIANDMQFSSALPLGDEPGKLIIVTEVLAGQLTKLDSSSNLTNTNPQGSGLLEPTNQ